MNKDPEELEQILPYLGERGGDPGRRCSIRSGIVGKAAREMGVFVAVRAADDYDEFRKEMRNEWFFTDSDVRNLSPDRFSWMAVPIISSYDQGKTVAVVFLDSNKRDTFESDAVRKAVINCCKGIASYIHETYERR